MRPYKLECSRQRARQPPESSTHATPHAQPSGVGLRAANSRTCEQRCGRRRLYCPACDEKKQGGGKAAADGRERQGALCTARGVRQTRRMERARDLAAAACERSRERHREQQQAEAGEPAIARSRYLRAAERLDVPAVPLHGLLDEAMARLAPRHIDEQRVHPSLRPPIFPVNDPDGVSARDARHHAKKDILPAAFHHCADDQRCDARIGRRRRRREEQRDDAGAAPRVAH